MFNHILMGLTHVFSLENLLLVLAGTVAGMIVGSLPGLTATMAVALLVPFTYTMSPVAGLVTLGAIYMGCIYGGCFSAILINTPGTPSSIGTTFDGYPLAKQGRGEEAIVAATLASAVGGLVGVIALIFLSPPLAEIALRFGPAEYFWVGVFGLTIISSLAAGSFLKGMTGAGLGVLISTIGIAPIGGDVRFTFDIPAMQGGLNLIVMLIGLFCVPELLTLALNGVKNHQALEFKKQKGVLGDTVRKVLSKPGNLIRSSIIGTVVGILPGAGGNIANLVAYNEARRASKHPEKFGTGIIDGVVATEAANNAVVGGGMIPLVTLGIPGAPPDAIIYGVLMLQGLRPGPELFTERADITYTFMLAVGLSAIVMIPVGLYGGRLLSRFVATLSPKYLIPGIGILTIVGSYAIRNNYTDVLLMLIFGVIGFGLRYLGFHGAPIVLGLILGPIMEEGLVQSYLMGQGNAWPYVTLFTSPLSWVLIAFCLMSFFWPYLGHIKRFLRRPTGRKVPFDTDKEE
ncbi:tripartite tricarboxylate transporter permease [Pelobacter seleniigenes]|uniref:tripartite tricarboxylate transporter permease n=1 Tax=Pelobacter seleniigenes TaxID=407188 RepID=UPI000AA2F4E0|nr:tripartite tricarboxylate transporter permease [Pelobacter seleniigenes]